MQMTAHYPKRNRHRFIKCEVLDTLEGNLCSLAGRINGPIFAVGPMVEGWVDRIVIREGVVFDYYIVTNGRKVIASQVYAGAQVIPKIIADDRMSSTGAGILCISDGDPRPVVITFVACDLDVQGSIEVYSGRSGYRRNTTVYGIVLDQSVPGLVVGLEQAGIAIEYPLIVARCDQSYIGDILILTWLALSIIKMQAYFWVSSPPSTVGASRALSPG